jgi:hypothetical protein
MNIEAIGVCEVAFGYAPNSSTPFETFQVIQAASEYFAASKILSSDV